MAFLMRRIHLLILAILLIPTLFAVNNAARAHIEINSPNGGEAPYVDDAFIDTTCVIEIAGDVNLSGAITSADVIYMIGYVFKGGDPPMPCAANGDVKCDGIVTAADIIYLVNHFFKGGPAPCDICNDAGAMLCTN